MINILRLILLGLTYYHTIVIAKAVFALRHVLTSSEMLAQYYPAAAISLAFLTYLHLSKQKRD